MVHLGKDEVDILLVEYEACHKNRDHYENIKWIIGTIFLSTSLAMFGVSFTDIVRNSLAEVSMLALFSVGLVLIWQAYRTYVNLYIYEALKRLWQIEKELQELGFNAPRLHTSIRQKRPPEKVKGKLFRYSLILLVLGSWGLRLCFFFFT